MARGPSRLAQKIGLGFDERRDAGSVRVFRIATQEARGAKRQLRAVSLRFDGFDGERVRVGGELALRKLSVVDLDETLGAREISSNDCPLYGVERGERRGAALATPILFRGLARARWRRLCDPGRWTRSSCFARCAGF